MITCGLKLTHDAGVAVISDGRLVAAIEAEKLNNGDRHSEFHDLTQIDAILDRLGIDAGDVDMFAVDGWGYGDNRERLIVKDSGTPLSLAVAPYRESQLDENLLAPFVGTGLPLGNRKLNYTSFHHTMGHVASGYCCSPFAARGEPAAVLVWDGGTLPRAYLVRPDPVSITPLGPLFGLIGDIYATFSMHIDPFKPSPDVDIATRERLQLSVPGKVMAYTSLGTARHDLMTSLQTIYEQSNEVTMGFGHTLASRLLVTDEGQQASGADILASFQAWLGNTLIDGLEVLREWLPRDVRGICLTGGCALNIKWNSSIRDSNLFDEVWVPPFPNDSGSAIGAACASMMAQGGPANLEWDVYSGPELTASRSAPDGWHSSQLSVSGLAQWLHRTGNPVVLLDGFAELGPRALGNRSIIAPADADWMKKHLNDIKQREDYRPVSPVCLESRARDVFQPGDPNPYMLFENLVRPEWADRIPAVLHLDGSARVQTVSRTSNPVLAELLEEYERVSGLPVLCNTSANLPGKGFFPDVTSALEWGRVPAVWSDGTIWTRP